MLVYINYYNYGYKNGIYFLWVVFYFGMLKIFVVRLESWTPKLDWFIPARRSQGLQLELDASHVELGLCDEEIVPNV